MPEEKQRSTSKHIDDEKDLLDWIDSDPMERVAEYLRCGRLYAHLANMDLAERWKASIEALAADVFSKQTRRTESQLRIEIEQRGLEVPYDTAEGSLEILSSKLMDHFDELLLEHPDEFENAIETASRRFAEFKRGQRQSGH
jgi:hypothetical protein